ncbi:MAG TPA: hypothetical protein VK447_19670 [Myxococcaceae bacterium]|nr:hypothetical protein [Myxococcaceae bacterium]
MTTISQTNISSQVSNLMGLVSRDIGKIAGTAVGKQVGELLSRILGSGFSGGAAPTTGGAPAGADNRLPSPLSRFGDQLKQLGIVLQTLGGVLNALDKLLGGNRGMPIFNNPLPIPGGTQTGAPTGAGGAGGAQTGAPTGAGAGGTADGNPVDGIGDPNTNKDLGEAWKQLDTQQKASINIQKAISRQTEAAALIGNIMKAKHDAQMQTLGSLK